MGHHEDLREGLSLLERMAATINAIGQVPALRTDEGVQYHFLPGTAKRLLTPPGAPSIP